VGVDPTLVTADQARKLSEKIKKKGGADLKPVSQNLVDMVWHQEKPGRPNEKIRVLDEKYAGKKFETKIHDLRTEIYKKKTEGMIISMLDEIAWLFNLRGNDIDYNPVFFAYAMVTTTDSTLFVDESKLTDEVKSHLGKITQIRPYAAIFEELTARKESIASQSKPLKYLISNKSSWALSEALGGKQNIEEVRSPIGDSKALKNETEMEGMRACHIRDGAALSEYFAWLEDQLITKGKTLDEVEAADKLEQLRRYVDYSYNVG
jgi:Xaa-Pro aminopeptidase